MTEPKRNRDLEPGETIHAAGSTWTVTESHAVDGHPQLWRLALAYPVADGPDRVWDGSVYADGDAKVPDA